MIGFNSVNYWNNTVNSQQNYNSFGGNGGHNYFYYGNLLANLIVALNTQQQTGQIGSAENKWFGNKSDFWNKLFGFPANTNKTEVKVEPKNEKPKPANYQENRFRASYQEKFYNGWDINKDEKLSLSEVNYWTGGEWGAKWTDNVGRFDKDNDGLMNFDECLDMWKTYDTDKNGILDKPQEQINYFGRRFNVHAQLRQ